MCGSWAFWASPIPFARTFGSCSLTFCKGLLAFKLFKEAAISFCSGREIYACLSDAFWMCWSPSVGSVEFQPWKAFYLPAKIRKLCSESLLCFCVWTTVSVLVMNGFFWALKKDEGAPLEVGVQCLIWWWVFEGSFFCLRWEGLAEVWLEFFLQNRFCHVWVCH